MQQDGEGTVAGPDQGYEFNLEITLLKVGGTLHAHSWMMIPDALSVSPDYGTPCIALTSPWRNPLHIPSMEPN
ncbi:glucose dehydrogenase [Komagataeibacter medellinensis NBRC 3288]|uniref:Glucose dehydrogenase n=1 Tax=Komagataeibacter medellinensis (strain NBRC 3288 / BCRC 11682 / LMG 1693 / Kondo 51) TaxID=634177 RepID=G2I636_KOMMN|nr:hypothetical protein [Komagataeibacter medellinensis]BAK83583.1 glucose dehydrogenase [Komagataeibacter medellinensis NBRC 3288]